MTTLNTKKIAILGFGVEGIGLARYFSEKGISFSILDMYDADKLKAELEDKQFGDGMEFLDNEKIEKRLGKNYLDQLKDFDVIFRSPGISFYNIKIQDALKSGVEISSQIKLFFDLCPAKIIGVTGTKGKGTTASLISEILKKNTVDKPQDIFLAGNIGYPAITLLDEIKPDDLVILELSSFQLMDLEKSPHIAVVTNLTVDHLDYHEDISEYQDAKKSILRHQSEEDYAVLNCDSTFSSHFINSLQSNVQFFSSEIDNVEAIIKEGKVVLDPVNSGSIICQQEEIKLFGKHNLENIAASTLVAKILGVEDSVIRDVVKEFSGLPHRLELAGIVEDVKYINDSFATNPEPTMAAIEAFSEDKILILGGSSKGADFSDLAEGIAKTNVTAVFLIGAEANKIKNALKSSEYKGEIREGFSDLVGTLTAIREYGKPGDIVLFSPACASFDMFKNYKDRGEKFKSAVLKLSE